MNKTSEKKLSPIPRAEPPEQLSGTQIAPASKLAAGLSAVFQTLRFGWGEMGVVRGTKMLLEVNQKNGFDCQSCAWPNPDGERHMAEFCENGVKAVADEATTQR